MQKIDIRKNDIYDNSEKYKIIKQNNGKNF